VGEMEEVAWFIGVGDKGNDGDPWRFSRENESF
jgi:hypothetical protein